MLLTAACFGRLRPGGLFVGRVDCGGLGWLRNQKMVKLDGLKKEVAICCFQSRSLLAVPAISFFFLRLRVSRQAG